MNKYHTMLQDIHPLTSTNIPHPSITLHSNIENNNHNTYQDSNTIDFISNDGLAFVPPISQASPIYEFEDLDYQSGLTSYQKNHMAFRHSNSMATSTHMDIQPSMPINIKPESISNYTLYNNNGHHHPHHHPHHHDNNNDNDNAFPLSAPANIGQHSIDLSTSDGFYMNHHDQTQALSTSPHASNGYQQQHYHHHQQPQHPRSLDGTQSPGSQPRSFEDDYSIQVNMQAMMDKRRRRRESHNAVERRRRENINDRIQELGTLLPDIMTDTTKPNKGAILRKSVDHIRQLQQEVSTYSQRIKELEDTLKKLQTK